MCKHTASTRDPININVSDGFKKLPLTCISIGYPNETICWRLFLLKKMVLTRKKEEGKFVPKYRTKILAFLKKEDNEPAIPTY